ncbi:MAG: hypothetical protein HYZ51_00015 [Candidatus Doudnabacteria bacterium]|nr:hypothetical protein [Candidatus Doudnabacteria bacterium]
MKAQITSCLYNALILDEKMEYRLYEYEIEDLLPIWKEELITDPKEFIFVVTVNMGDVAMVLLTKNGEIFINEDARDKLKAIWKKHYTNSIKTLLPTMVKKLMNDELPVIGGIRGDL